MKKLISSIIALIMILTSLPLVVSADDDADVLTSSDGRFNYQIILEDRGKKYGEITSYLEKGSEITIPSSLDDCIIVGINTGTTYGAISAKNVTVSEGIEYITGKAFANTSINITLPTTLKYIGKNAFSDSTINRINFPEGLQAIDRSAFYDADFNEEFRNIVLPDSLLYLCNRAFADSNIESVAIGADTQICGIYYNWPAEISEYDTVEDISKVTYNPFINCVQLMTITVNEQNPYLSVKDNILYADDMKTLVKICGDRSIVVIPDSVEIICDNYFYGKEFESVTLGKSLKEIDTSMFSGSKLGKLIFAPDSKISTICTNAFSNCVISETVTFPASVRIIDKTAFLRAVIPQISFEENSSLQKINYRAFAVSEIPVIDLTNCTHLYYLNQDAFASSEISSIDLSHTYVSEIFPDVFKDCKLLKNVVLSDYTETVWYDSFKNCTALRSINRGQVNTFHADAFKGCDASLIENTNPREPINSDTFGDYEYTEYVSGITITKYIGYGGDVVIPNEINGKPVTEIGQYAFYYKKNIDSVVLPKHLEKIYTHAFASSDIKHISPLPDSVRYIGSYAFAWNSFDGLTLNEGVEYIGEYALEECRVTYIPDSVKYLGLGSLDSTFISEIYFGAGLVDIDDQIFEMTYGDNAAGEDIMLASIEVSADNPIYKSVDGVLYSKDGSELIRYPASKTDEKFVIPEAVKKLKSYSFAGLKYLKKLTVTKNVATIEDWALECTNSFESVEFTDNAVLKSLFYTFYDCKNLKSVKFGKNMAIKKMNSTFEGSGIEETEIPSSVRLLLQTFENTPLKSVKINCGVEIIGVGTFRNCNITSVSLPDSVQSVARLAFSGCDNLNEIELNSVRTLGSLTFENCTGLTSIDLTGVRYDNTDANNTFKGCTNLTKLYFTKEDSECYIGEDNVADNETVETVVIGGGIVEIKSRAFANCKNLSVAMISDGVTSIDETAFEGCDNLTIMCMEQSFAQTYAEKNSIPYTTLVVDAIPDQTYTGKPLTPPLNVHIGNADLFVNKDYSASYEDNIAVGTAKVTVLGKGDYEIFGTVSRFQIVKDESVTPQPTGDETDTDKPTEKPAPTSDTVQPQANALTSSDSRVRQHAPSTATSNAIGQQTIVVNTESEIMPDSGQDDALGESNDNADDATTDVINNADSDTDKSDKSSDEESNRKPYFAVSGITAGCAISAIFSYFFIIKKRKI